MDDDEQTEDQPELSEEIREYVARQRAEHADDEQPVIELDGRRLS